MAKQEIDIGFEGNDGTGDSIRDSFRKVNENFDELYATFGVSGDISITNISDLPDQLLGSEGHVLLVNPNGSAVEFYEMVSDGGDNDPENPLNTINFSISDNKLVVKSLISRLGEDPAPTLTYPLNAGAVLAYNNTLNDRLLNKDFNSITAEWNILHSTQNEITSSNIIISKGYADSNYLTYGGLTETLDAGGNVITNIAEPENNSDATTKLYVDTTIDNSVIKTLAELVDVSISTPDSGDFLVFTGTDSQTVNATVNGDVEASLVGNTLTLSIKTGVITDNDINNSANISQSKLALLNATSGGSGTTKGIASFNSAHFDVNQGYVSIASDSVGNNELINSDITIGTTTISLGATSTTLAGLTGVTSNTFTGSLSGNATSATVANTVSLVATNTTNATHYLAFTDSSTGAESIRTDTGLTYNPSSGILTAVTFNGNATSATTASSTTIVSSSAASSHFITFVNSDNGDRQQLVNTGLNFVPSTGDLTTYGNILPSSTLTQNIGSSDVRWNNIYCATLVQSGADLAENYLADAQYEPGTVLVFGGEFEVTVTSIKADHRVAGVVSTEPASLMNSALGGTNVVPLALTGRVPCKVAGRVRRGDILVTSAIPGYAIVDNSPKPGTIIGKAVGVKDSDIKGVVEVVVGRT